MSKEIDLTEIEILNKILSNSLKKKITEQLENTGNKIKIIENQFGKREDFPKGIIFEIYTADDKLILQTMQG